MNEIPNASPNFRTELAQQLSELVPEAIADGNVDVAKLKEMLGDDCGDDNERFGLFWPGKKRALRAAQEPTTATLKPVPSESKDWDTTQNVYIEGDNLEVLKILQKHYHNKIKVIYIDPPYNTGNDFIYPDNYTEGLQSYLEFTRQVDEEGRALRTNSEAEGRYHSNWLNMMYPRLKLARNLLTDDGVILVSIDDHEHAHLRKLTDEIFGESNFIACICHKSRGSISNDKVISPNHNFILAYARSFNNVFSKRGNIGLDPHLNGFNLEDQRGKYKLVPVDGPGGSKKGNPFYEFQGVEGYFRYSKATMQELFDAGEIVKRANTLQRKYYLESAMDRRKTDTTWWDDAGYTSSATSALKVLMSGDYFDSPKPVGLIKRMIKQFAYENESIVVDFFSGSGTTAHAVMQLNAEDGGNRQFIQVQLPEPTSKESTAFKAGFKTIPEIGRKRIDLAGEMIKAELEKQLMTRETPLDIGYRTYKLVDTNFPKWKVGSEIDDSTLRQELRGLGEAGNGDNSSDDLLTELLLKQGYSLTEQITHLDVDGLSVLSIGDNLLLAYLDTQIKPNLEQLRSLVEIGPVKLVVLDDVFQGDDELKTNLVQICKSKDIELWTA